MTDFDKKLPNGNKLVWSYTMLDLFEQCPRRWHDRYILGNKETETEALRYGKYVHGSIENYLHGTSPLPADIPGQNLVEAVKKSFAGAKRKHIELRMGLTKDTTPCGFFESGVWGRSAADVAIEGFNSSIFLGDWKTGKKREKKDQLEILSLFIFANFPAVKQISACNIWLQNSVMGEMYTFRREDEEKMWAVLLTRLENMYSVIGTPEAEDPKPGYLCKGYCSVKSCEHNQPRG